MSSELVKKAEGETSAEVRKGLTDASDSLVAMGVSTVGIFRIYNEHLPDAHTD
jgi:hypothetical protein